VNTLCHRFAGIVVALAILLAGMMGTTVLEDSVLAAADGEKAVADRTITEVLKERTEALMSVRGVVGAGEGLCDGRPCIKVYVVKKTAEVEQEIRRMLDPYPFAIQESGRFQSR
jgi:hypothetical protein